MTFVNYNSYIYRKISKSYSRAVEIGFFLKRREQNYLFMDKCKFKAYNVSWNHQNVSHRVYFNDFNR